MLRGGVFIGVNRTQSGFPLLHAAASGARQMYEWAVAPEYGGIDPQMVRLITDDADHAVTAKEVKESVQEIIDLGVDQFILYFAGHGLTVNTCEVWLLSGAPLDAGEAINVEMSRKLAERGRTPYVVIVSDACRTPTTAIDLQYISAVPAFPNPAAPGPKKRVEVFYATGGGGASAELNTVDCYGIYTRILADALHGKLREAGGTEADVLQQGQTGDGSRYVWSEPLSKYLSLAIPTLIQDLKLNINQEPDAVVPAGRTSWLARVPPADTKDRGTPTFWPTPPTGPRRPSLETAMTVSQLAHALLDAIELDPATPLASHLERAMRAPAMDARAFVDLVASLNEPFPGEVSGDTVMQVRGARVVSARSAEGAVVVSDEHTVGRTAMNAQSAVTVALAMSNETIAVLPILPGRTTKVDVRDRQIVSVAFEREINAEMTLAAQESGTRAIRAIVAAAAWRGQLGVALAGRELARRLYDSDDPAIAVYAAYAADAIQDNDTVAQIERGPAHVGGYTLFDAALVADRISTAGDLVWSDAVAVIPSIPMLSRGWQLMQSDELPGWLRAASAQLLPSLWTVFSSSAETLLTSVVNREE